LAAYKDPNNLSSLADVPAYRDITLLLIPISVCLFRLTSLVYIRRIRIRIRIRILVLFFKPMRMAMAHPFSMPVHMPDAGYTALPKLLRTIDQHRALVPWVRYAMRRVGMTRLVPMMVAREVRVFLRRLGRGPLGGRATVREGVATGALCAVETSLRAVGEAVVVREERGALGRAGGLVATLIFVHSVIFAWRGVQIRLDRWFRGGCRWLRCVLMCMSVSMLALAAVQAIHIGSRDICGKISNQARWTQLLKRTYILQGRWKAGSRDYMRMCEYLRSII
jgi:hypothetical protein